MPRPHSPGRAIALAVLASLLAAPVAHAQQTAPRAAPHLAAPHAAASPAGLIDALAHDYWEEVLADGPEGATYLGDHRWGDRLSDPSPAARARHLALLSALELRLGTALDGVDIAKLDEQHVLTAAVLQQKLSEERDAERFKFETYAVDQLNGPQVSFVQLALNIHPRDTADALLSLLARYVGLKRYMDAYVANLRDGLRAGRTAPRIAVERVIKQLDDLVGKPAAEHPLARVAKDLRKPPAGLSPDELARLDAAFRLAVERSVMPAFAELRRFLREEYLPLARKDVGVWSVPAGADAYAFLARKHTTTDLSPERMHAIGREELARIEEEMTAIAKRMKHKGDLRSFADRMRKEGEAGKPETEAQTVERYKKLLARFDAKLPEVFGRLPSIGYTVEPMPAFMAKDAPAAYYNPPTLDGARQGIFYVNTATRRPAFLSASLAAHEAVPGHHLQIALAYDLKDLPAVRRLDGFTAFVEGWALYAERLADELGLYADDRERYGMLSNRAWRACRLVVDTGMHAMKWTREQAIEFLEAHSALPRAEVENEVDRYITWPGQALAYMVGALEIQAAREQAKQELGARFSLKGFHDVVLASGALPIAVVRERVARWTRDAGAPKTEPKRP